MVPPKTYTCILQLELSRAHTTHMRSVTFAIAVAELQHMAGMANKCCLSPLFSLVLTFLRHLPLAMMPRTQDLSIFVWTTATTTTQTTEPITLHLAHVCGVKLCFYYYYNVLLSRPYPYTIKHTKYTQ